MTKTQKLILLKLLHTLIWVFYNVVVAYLAYAVIKGKLDKWVWICLGLIALGGLVLLVFKNVCPLTILARRYSSSTKNNFDIYLPNWLAKYNKHIYTAMVLLILIVLFSRIFLT